MDATINKGGGQVLIVEDDRVSRETLGAILKHLGFTIVAASTLAEGLAGLMNAPRLVILDMMLPDGSGVELLRRIRRHKLSTKVAVVTGATDPHIEQEVFQLRPDAFFGKPIDPKDFFDWLSELPAEPVAAGAAPLMALAASGPQ